MAQYDIFVSYRREASGVVGTTIAKLIAAELQKDNKFRVFIDSEIRSGEAFDSQIREALQECSDFLLVLTDGCLDRCLNADDWVAAEIRAAKALNKNIIPIYVDDFAFPRFLPEDLMWLTAQEAPTPRLRQSEKNAVASCVSLLIQGKHLKSKPRTKLIESVIGGVEKVGELKNAVSETFGGKEEAPKESNAFSLIGGIVGVAALAGATIFGLTYFKNMNAEAETKEAENPPAVAPSGNGGGSVAVAPTRKPTPKLVSTSKPVSAPALPPKKPVAEATPVADTFTEFDSDALKSFAQSQCFSQFSMLEELEDKALELKIEIKSVGDNATLKAKAEKALEAVRAKAEKIRRQIVKAYEEKDSIPKTYKIGAGDSSLKRIAAKLGCSAKELQDANPKVDFSPRKLRRGMEINIPESVRERMALEKLSGVFEGDTYEVVQGDTAAKIATKLGCSVEDLKKANPKVDFSLRGLRRGMKLNVPEKE